MTDLTTTPQPSLTVAQYLERERGSSHRHDLVGGLRHRVPDTSPEHDRLVANVCRTLVDSAEWLAANAEEGETPPTCRVMSRTVNLMAFEGAVYYPDVMVVCDAEPDEMGIEHEPCLLVEVMTSGRETIDEFEMW